MSIKDFFKVPPLSKEQIRAVISEQEAKELRPAWKADGAARRETSKKEARKTAEKYAERTEELKEYAGEYQEKESLDEVPAIERALQREKSETLQGKERELESISCLTPVQLLEKKSESFLEEAEQYEKEAKSNTGEEAEKLEHKAEVARIKAQEHTLEWRVEKRKNELSIDAGSSEEKAKELQTKAEEMNIENPKAISEVTTWEKTEIREAKQRLIEVKRELIEIKKAMAEKLDDSPARIEKLEKWAKEAQKEHKHKGYAGKLTKVLAIEEAIEREKNEG